MRNNESELEQKYQEAVEKLEISHDKITELQSKIEEITQTNEWEKSKQKEDKTQANALLKEKEDSIIDLELK